MYITYDKEADATYISIADERKTHHTTDVQGDINIDYDKYGTIIGIEILHAPQEIINLNSEKGHEYMNRICGGEKK